MNKEPIDILKKPGYLNYQLLKEVVQREFIDSPKFKIKSDQYQPASLDLRIGEKAYRIRSSFLPDSDLVENKLNKLKMYEIDLRDGGVLEKEGMYLIPILEELKLPEYIKGETNPKSTTGRLDIFSRIVTNRNHRFDEIKCGYEGKLYLQLISRSFTVKVKTGYTFSQLRLLTDANELSDDELKDIHVKTPLLFNDDGRPLHTNEVIFYNGLFISVSLSGIGKNRLIGYRAKKNSSILDLSQVDYYEISEFWDPIYENNNSFLILEPEEFYILVSKEKVRIPLEYVGEMIAYEPNSGELRSHYAGFFDPGFGYGNDGSVLGTRAILEVRAHDAPFMVEHGQTFCKLHFKKVISPPEVAYGDNKLNSHYQSQNLTLSKQFCNEKEFQKLIVEKRKTRTLPLFDEEEALK